MVLDNIKLYNFRSYTEREFVFSPDVTVIVGKNGAGKTNILEALYVLLQGRSFRDNDESLLCYTTDWWRVHGFMGDDEREVRYQPGQTAPKQLLVNGVSKGRFTYKQQLPVVLFEPDDLLLIHGSPSARRAYLDSLLIQTVPTYRTTLARYERAVLQRNTILKKGGSLSALHDAVFVWDIALSEYGAEIITQRRRLVATLNQQLGKHYTEIAQQSSTFTVTYEPQSKHGSHGLAQLLSRSLEKDRLRGFTGVGPHRDDVGFVLNGKDARTTASRGEVRTIVLALKRAELDILHTTLDVRPLFLLDDVLSELDETRQEQVIRTSSQFQRIVTSTHIDQSQQTATLII